jgi:squalene-associated FAD-dependent desaturase
MSEGGRVAVVGAGYAGCAAAVTLAAGGVPVTLIDAAAVPGGRARRVRAHERELDNGQHILIGAYSELLRLMHTVGVPSEAVLRMPLELRYADGFSLRALWLPAPLGLLAGLLAARRLPFAERLGAVRFMRALRRAAYRVEPDCTVSELLARHQQNGRIGHYVWRPLCVSALNTPPEQASAQVFANVLRDSLAGGDGASDLLLPATNLSALFPEPASEFVRAHGGELRTSAPVREISPDLRVDGELFAHIILAVAPYQLKPFAQLTGAIPEYSYQPIYTCYLQYDQRVRLPLPMLGLAEGLVQWVFDRGALGGAKGLLACMISAQGDHQQMTHDELAAACHRELARTLPGLAAPEWTQVIAEKRATISCTPGIRRPPLETPTPRLYLAGDYTDPDYPPTLEAAVRSGVRAAQRVLRG